jgi:hypothetical protein
MALSPLLYPSVSDRWFRGIIQTVGLIPFKHLYIHRVRGVYRTAIEKIWRYAALHEVVLKKNGSSNLSIGEI